MNNKGHCLSIFVVKDTAVASVHVKHSNTNKFGLRQVAMKRGGDVTFGLLIQVNDIVGALNKNYSVGALSNNSVGILGGRFDRIDECLYISASPFGEPCKLRRFWGDVFSNDATEAIFYSIPYEVGKYVQRDSASD